MRLVEVVARSEEVKNIEMRRISECYRIINFWKFFVL